MIIKLGSIIVDLSKVESLELNNGLSGCKEHQYELSIRMVSGDEKKLAFGTAKMRADVVDYILEHISNDVVELIFDKVLQPTAIPAMSGCLHIPTGEYRLVARPWK